MTSPVPSDTRAAAIELIHLGWAPVPVPRRQKGLFEAGWQKLRISEADVPEKFTGRENIGILTGEASGGLIDVDLDCDEAVALASAFLPATTMQSGRPSRPRSHRWYLVDAIPDYRIFNDVDADKSALVELRGNGHQTLVAPSVHPQGEVYVWHGPLEPAPVDGRDLERVVGRLAAAAIVARHWPKKPGSRHSIANALAGMLLRGGYSDRDAATFVFQVANAAGDEEACDRKQAALATAKTLDRGDAATGKPTLSGLLGSKIVERVRQWLHFDEGESDVLALGDWDQPVSFHSGKLPHFPVNALPDWLANYTTEEAIATQTPKALAGSLVLAACSAGLAGRVRVEVRPGWQEPTNLYLVVVLDPGNRKSAVFSDVTLPIKAYEKAEILRLKPEIQEAAGRLRVLAQRAKEAEKKAAKAPVGDRLQLEQEAVAAAIDLANTVVPVYPRMFVDDVTPEKLAALLSEHGGRIAVLSAEGGIFDLMAGRYSGDKAPNLDVFLKGHVGDALRVDRIGRPPDCVDHPALTVGLTVQGSVLRGLASNRDFVGRGLLARFLYSIPESFLGRREIGVPPVPGSIQMTYEKNLTTILALGFATDDEEQPAPHVTRLDAEAHSLFREFEVELEPRLGPDGDLGAITAWGAKLSGAIARIAAIIHVAQNIDHPAPWTISVNRDTVSKAIALGRYYLSHAKAAFAEMGADPEVESARHVLAWISRHHVSQFSEREAFQGTKGRFKKVADLRPALLLLVDHGFIRKRPQPERKGPGRRPGQGYDVNPNFENIENIGERTQKCFLSDSSSLDSNSTTESRPQYSQNPQDPSVTPPDLNSEPPAQNSQYPQYSRDGDPDLDEEITL